MLMQKKTQQPKPRNELIAAWKKLGDALNMPVNLAAANSGNYNYEQGQRDLIAYLAELN